MSTISGVSGSSDPWGPMKAHRSQMQAKMFAKVDTDGSGGVDQAELKTMLSDISQKTGVSLDGDTAEAFSTMDSNADGSLSSEELGQGMQSLMPPPPSTLDFAQMRSGGGTDNGTGSPDGPSGPPPAGGPGGSGGAGTSESASSQTYDKLDTNQDGTVSELERLVDVAKLAQQMYTQIAASLTEQSSNTLSVSA
ncbi:MAG: EF-hand domain-containing protein [Rhodoferax sp.]|nr:EF-hand domain-containing protein [Rhodoferax sp.]MDP3653598.1 EF-hand domain-containing protein [Rhodoferax sp.]